MARKLEARKPAAGKPSAAETLAIISPDIKLRIAGRDIVVREYGFFEGLEVAHRSAPFIAAIHDMCRDGELRYDRIRRLFGVHRDVVVHIAAQSGEPPKAESETESAYQERLRQAVSWVNSLQGPDAESFMSAWFSVNAGFFVHEVIVEMREERQRHPLLSIGPKSSSASPGSETSIASAASPSGS